MSSAMEAASSPYVAFWNDMLAEKFERFRGILTKGMSHHSRVPLDELSLPAGARVLDVGCGWGDTAIELARMVGPEGYVLGVDCVDRFLDKGRRDAMTAGLDNVEFLAADVETYPFAGGHDLCYSRFGMMFFGNPMAAMRNIAAALRPGGELLFSVWRPIDDNPWLRVGKEVVLDFVPAPGEDVRHCGPGPFSMSDPGLVREQLQRAGLEPMEFRRLDGPVIVGHSVDEAVEFQLALGPAGEAFREAGELAERRRGEIEQALRHALAPYQQDGRVVMPSSSWSITARKPTG
ncbi:methyltransferase domain-containing protein [Ectothiorhodospiraceae bacterium WFHF3C12]|nr:methyltransferase domain-containing protein [Ectothiorhodospiraceae bacterium WFHF3C12]